MPANVWMHFYPVYLLLLHLQGVIRTFFDTYGAFNAKDFRDLRLIFTVQFYCCIRTLFNASSAPSHLLSFSRTATISLFLPKTQSHCSVDYLDAETRFKAPVISRSIHTDIIALWYCIDPLQPVDSFLQAGELHQLYPMLSFPLWLFGHLFCFNRSQCRSLIPKSVVYSYQPMRIQDKRSDTNNTLCKLPRWLQFLDRKSVV